MVLNRPEDIYRKRKTYHGFERSQHSTIVKRRKSFDRVSVVSSDGGFSSERVSNSPQKGTDGGNPNSCSKLHVPEDSRGNILSNSFILLILIVHYITK